MSELIQIDKLEHIVETFDERLFMEGRQFALSYHTLQEGAIP